MMTYANLLLIDNRGSLCDMLGDDGVSKEASVRSSFPFTLPEKLARTRHLMSHLQVCKLKFVKSFD